MKAKKPTTKRKPQPERLENPFPKVANQGKRAPFAEYTGMPFQANKVYTLPEMLGFGAGCLQRIAEILQEGFERRDEFKGNLEEVKCSLSFVRRMCNQWDQWVEYLEDPDNAEEGT
jgi:hypothetical protein